MGSLTFSGQSGKVCHTHSVDPIGDLDLGMLAVAYIAPNYANAVPPTHRIPGTPNPTHLPLRRDPAPTRGASWLCAARPRAVAIDRTYRSSLAGPLSEYALQF